ncbi:putative GNAT family acetyltransferase [Actinoplanes tereljensis]|uniref:GNAT family N-acetyltransferase n=1 Tax=Paractinoplanes tereljensis TaxID=571912 RepID=UPI001EF26E14|nr:GNAT family N-acetyltransferase [Actinoplanes tereljensis]
MPAAVEVLAGRALSGVNMLADSIDEFVAGWRELTGAKATVDLRSRLYLLDALTPPAAPGGRARVADHGDRELLLRWDAAFHDDIGERQPADGGAAIDERLGYGGILLWEVDGVPVSAATRSPIHAGMSRVQTVYTPKEHRGRGYAGAVTTAATQSALDQGAEAVVLFTDLANPTSNGLYQRLGYRPVEDRVVVEFS